MHILRGKGRSCGILATWNKRRDRKKKKTWRYTCIVNRKYFSSQRWECYSHEKEMDGEWGLWRVEKWGKRGWNDFQSTFSVSFSMAIHRSVLAVYLSLNIICIYTRFSSLYSNGIGERAERGLSDHHLQCTGARSRPIFSSKCFLLSRIKRETERDRKKESIFMKSPFRRLARSKLRSRRSLIHFRPPELVHTVNRFR